MLKACIDSNVWISGVAFGGPPAAIVSAALNHKFEVIASQIILEEVERALMSKKIGFGRSNTKRFIHRLLQVVDLYEPSGSVRVIPNHHPDNLILETAVSGRAKYLVTGDREHLLPLKHYRMVRIIEPAHFLNLLKRP